MGALNPHQLRHIVSTFTYVDSLLQAAEHVTQPELSPFSKEQPDMAPDEARLLRSFIRLARERMLDALDRLNIPRPKQSVSARWNAETSLKFAESSLAELKRERLSGYGHVDEEVAAELAALAADLEGVVRRARQVFHDADAAGVTSVIARVPGVIGTILREVDNVSRGEALAEIRPLLAAAAERTLSGTFDVGVFGRVSAGKSSLINALAGESVLPVGATPVTAVPTRLSRGEHGALVNFVDGSSREIPIRGIAEFATAERNPENRAGVRTIEVLAPTVPEGLRLVDTPGVGSLGSSGPALAFQWLPRCDLGLVLVAAASAVSREDLALVAGLSQAGIRAIVLLSKADLLAPGGINPAIAYVRQELTASLGPNATVEVRAVSTSPDGVQTLIALRDEVIAPLARNHARAAQRALIQRLRRLLDRTAAALAGRRRGKVEDDAVQLQRARARAAERVQREVDHIESSTPAVLEAAARAAEGAWQSGDDARVAVRSAIVRAAGESLGALTSAIDSVREAAGLGVDAVRRVPPFFDPEFLDTLPPSLPRRWRSASSAILWLRGGWNPSRRFWLKRSSDTPAGSMPGRLVLSKKWGRRRGTQGPVITNSYCLPSSSHWPGCWTRSSRAWLRRRPT